MESHYLDKRDDLASLAGGHATKELLEHYLERNWYQFFRAKASLPLRTLSLEMLTSLHISAQNSRTRSATQLDSRLLLDQ